MTPDSYRSKQLLIHWRDVGCCQTQVETKDVRAVVEEMVAQKIFPPILA